MTDFIYSNEPGMWHVRDRHAPRPGADGLSSGHIDGLRLTPDEYACCVCGFRGIYEIVLAHLEAEHPEPDAAAPREGESDAV